MVPPGEAERKLPAPGTWVRAYGQCGCVMPYDHARGSVPVRFDSGRWAVLGLDDLDPPPGEKPRPAAG